MIRRKLIDRYCPAVDWNSEMNKFFSDKRLKSNPFLNWLELFIILSVMWFVMSQIFHEVKFLVFGIGSSIIISYFCLNSLTMDGLKSENRYFLLHINVLKFVSYFIWLIGQIIISSLDVTKVIFSDRSAIEQKIIWFKADYDNPAARALLANSITLTPGTVTMDIYDNGIYTVHALTDSAAEGLLEGSMQRKVADVFRETIDYRVVNIQEESIEQRERERRIQLVRKKYRRSDYSIRRMTR